MLQSLDLSSIVPTNEEQRIALVARCAEAAFACFIAYVGLFRPCRQTSRRTDIFLKAIYVAVAVVAKRTLFPAETVDHLIQTDIVQRARRALFGFVDAAASHDLWQHAKPHVSAVWKLVAFEDKCDSAQENSGADENVVDCDTRKHGFALRIASVLMASMLVIFVMVVMDCPRRRARRMCYVSLGANVWLLMSLMSCRHARTSPVGDDTSSSWVRKALRIIVYNDDIEGYREWCTNSYTATNGPVLEKCACVGFALIACYILIG